MPCTYLTRVGLSPPPPKVVMAIGFNIEPEDAFEEGYAAAKREYKAEIESLKEENEKLKKKIEKLKK